MSPPTDPEGITDDLIARARRGDKEAREELVERSWNVLRRYAHGRLPRPLRGSHQTTDLVQSAFARAFPALETFEARGPGAFLAFMRRILLNRIRDLARGARAVRPHEPAPEQLADSGPQPFEEVASSEVQRAYQDELRRLTPLQQSATVLRFELGWSYEQIAAELELASANAARMCVMRGAARLRRGLRMFAG